MLVAVGALAAMSFLLATLLAVANKKLYVEEDPRIEAVLELLPGTNCGACGFPGCRGLAEALAGGTAQPAKCTVATEAERADIATYLGVDVGAQAKIVARLACAGGANVARLHAFYQGVESCRAAALIGGGGKGCNWGCLGYGDCEAVCDFDAISMDQQSLPRVLEEACTACGDCVDACPKDLFSLQPVSHQLWVACRNLQNGDPVLEDCEVGCTACGRCAADAPGLVTMQDGLPVVDYTRSRQTRAAIERCPTGAIVWLDPQKGVQYGQAARRVIRKNARRASVS